METPGKALPAGATGAAAQWEDLVKSFVARYVAAHPTFGAGSGRHEFDGRLPDWGPAAFEHEVARLREDRRRALAFDPAALDEPRRFERELLVAVTDADLFWLEEAEWHRRNPLFYSGPLDPNLYLSRDYAPLEQRLRSYVGYARQVPRAAEQVRANLRTPLPRTYAELGEMSFGGLAGYYESDVPVVFAAVDDPDLQRQMREANAEAARAMRELGAWFHDQIPPAGEASGEFRLGADLYGRRRSATERVDVPLADLVFVSAHEVWPGHFLQFLHSNRAASSLGQLFVGYGFAEGWAHYSEELMWEAGFGGGDPFLHIGQLQNALLRNVRYLVALGLHTGDLTVEEAERMFREQAFQDPANARQQAARGTFDPGFLNYALGKLMIRKLREDWTAPRGGRAAWREFHDRLLSYGGPPIPLVRRAMMGGGAGAGV